MINAINLVRNIGQFDSVNGSQFQFSQVTLIYAENGRGKTTITAIFRSLVSGESTPIYERHRLGAQQTPHVVIDCTGGPPLATFQNNSWNRQFPDMYIFDDVFIDQNVHSGLALNAGHRQNLHELVLGAQGVTLNQQLQTQINIIEDHNKALREKAAAIPTAVRGPYSIDHYCSLQPLVTVDNDIREIERQLAAIRTQGPIRTTLILDILSLPLLDTEAINEVLQQNIPSLNEAAAEQVRNHLVTLGQGGERWVAEGMRFRSTESGSLADDQCPFCAKSLSGSEIIIVYQAYFSEAYANLKRDISVALESINREHGGDAATVFERAVRIAGERRLFWSQFCDVPEIRLDTVSIVQDWSNARDAVAMSLRAKQTSPLESIVLSDDALCAIGRYENHRQSVARLNQGLQQANTLINAVKTQSTTANPITLETELVRLKAVKSRFTPAFSALCNDYLVEKRAKVQTEQSRDRARNALDQYRSNIFPIYQGAINNYLTRFNAGFRLENVAPVNIRGGTTCNFEVVINNTPVPVAGGTPAAGEPSFRNTLSGGDRNALALAFFLASLDQDPSLANKTVVIDDPISSLDEHRSLTTVQEIRRLSRRVAQLIILSHNKPFLCRIWEGANPQVRFSLQVASAGASSTLRNWDVNDDCITENDRHHALLREYLATGTLNNREVAESIRPVLEAYFRVARPQYMVPGTLLGQFCNVCQQRIGTAQEILDQTNTQELRDIIEYANKFHHDTNPAWASERINDVELAGFVQRTLNIILAR